MPIELAVWNTPIARPRILRVWSFGHDRVGGREVDHVRSCQQDRDHDDEGPRRQPVQRRKNDERCCGRGSQDCTERDERSTLLTSNPAGHGGLEQRAQARSDSELDGRDRWGHAPLLDKQNAERDVRQHHCRTDEELSERDESHRPVGDEGTK
ncbi:hypothetical protein Q9Q99_19675 [Curtobacterium flaccumfaciens]|nr:hypothetical protein Q9Q99_19675 [Curtobacterium flaccumfaciens]